MRRKAVCASDETSNKVLGSEHPPALIRVQADGRGGKAFCASNGEHPIQYLGLSTQTPWPAKPTWHLPNRINDGQRQKSWMYKWWRHSSYYFDLLGGSTCQESGDTNFLFGRRNWAGGQAEKKKKKRRGIMMVMREKAFLAFLVLVLIISFSLVAALPCGHISLYVHRLATCLLRY